ncbi:Transcription initiation factor TFIID subunit 4 [Spathaspora sp. JA1]|nr:Transcription initiation factor TFIID subunit 4 [Spathaspora sp. JA1]
MTNGEELKRPSDSQITNNGTKKQKVDGISGDGTSALFSSNALVGINENTSGNGIINNGDQMIPTDSQALKDTDLENLPVSLLQSASINNSQSTDGNKDKAKPNEPSKIQQEVPQQTTKEKPLDNTDPSKLNDAIAAAGVDIQQEEELLFQQQLNRNTDVSKDLKQIIKTSQAPAFLNNYHLAAFLNKVAKENGIHQNFLQDGDMLELVSGACENWLSRIATKTIMLSRHRRRGIPANTTATGGKRSHHHHHGGSNTIPRSDASRELRNLAIKQKELEEKRVSKRILLGLERSANDPNGDADGKAGGESKAGAEETLHRATNETVNFMTGRVKKKYSWMNSGAEAGGSDLGKSGTDKDGGKISPIISIRGDNGLRFREIRSGNSIVMKDILGALEDERRGVDKAIIKGYAKLKD